MIRPNPGELLSIRLIKLRRSVIFPDYKYPLYPSTNDGYLAKEHIVLNIGTRELMPRRQAQSGADGHRRMITLGLLGGEIILLYTNDREEPTVIR